MIAARLLAVALLGLGLSGCWYGQGLFADSDARAVLAPGTYRVTEPGKSVHDVTISTLPSGMTKLTDPESDDGDAAYGFTFVPGKSGRFLGWFVKADTPSEQQTQMYFFVEKRGDSFAFFVPGCEGADQLLATGAGAAVETGSGESCRFRDKQSVLKAIAQVQPNESDRLVLTKRR
jgi:hypothetical protein